MSLIDYLNNLNLLTIAQLTRLQSVGLINPDQTLTALGTQLLNNPKNAQAINQLMKNQQQALNNSAIDDDTSEWIIPVPEVKQNKVFGPMVSCGDMASHTMGF